MNKWMIGTDSVALAQPAGGANRKSMRGEMARKLLLVCGILSSLLYVAMNVFLPMLFEGYSVASRRTIKTGRNARLSGARACACLSRSISRTKTNSRSTYGCARRKIEAGSATGSKRLRSEGRQSQNSKQACLPSRSSPTLLSYGSSYFDLTDGQLARDSPQRDPRDAWDERRNARLQKRQPGGERLLRVESRGRAGGEFGVDQAVDGLRVGYWLERNGETQPLNDLQWADWDRDGDLLVATRSGKLQVWNLDGDRSEVLFEQDLSLSEPNPAPAPAWAQRW